MARRDPPRPARAAVTWRGALLIDTEDVRRALWDRELRWLVPRPLGAAAGPALPTGR